MEVVLAAAASFFFALGTVLQQKGAVAEGGGGTGAGAAKLLLRLARRPVWVGGIVADGLGFLSQAAALAIGRLVVVQPVLATSVVFALPLGAKITDQRISRRDVTAAVIVTAGLAVFLVVGNPEGGRDNAPFGEIRTGKEKVNYLDLALADLKAGKPVAQSQTTAYGCSVKYAK